MARYLSSLLLTIALLVWVAGYIFFIMVASYAAPTDKTTKSDAIVVLTGGKFRTQTGLNLFANNLAPELMFTGVYTAVTENEIRALWKSEKPLPECCITLGHKAKTTLENAAETRDWVRLKNFKTIRLVTSPYHLQRAMLEFHAMIPDIKIIAHPVEQQDYAFTDARYWLITFSEYNKYIVRGAIIGLKQGFS